MIQFTEEEKHHIQQYATEITLDHPHKVLAYGAGAQKQAAEFAQVIWKRLGNFDPVQLREKLTELIRFLSGAPEPATRKRFFREKATADQAPVSFDEQEEKVDEACRILSAYQVQLLKEIAILDMMHEKYINHVKELQMYIEAGSSKLEHIRADELPQLQLKADQSKALSDIQEVQQLIAISGQFERKLYDLELTKKFSLQMIPRFVQLRNDDAGIQKNMQRLMEDIIPLWKKQQESVELIEKLKESIDLQTVSIADRKNIEAQF